MGTEARSQVQHCLSQGCNKYQPSGGKGCGGRSATICRRRNSAGVEGIYIQCDGCGSSLSSAIGKAKFAHPDRLPEWNQELWDQREADYAALHARTQAGYDEMRAAAAQVKADRAERIRTYEAWCRTSPEWHHLSGLVLQRARFNCEACLEAPSAVVHHETYDFGRLPMAWHLKAVCRRCHNRIHADKLGRDDEWCPC
jgi:hypothetical protein